MAIRLTCQACQATLQVRDEFAGRQGKCPKCGAMLRVPPLPRRAPEATAPATPEPTRQFRPKPPVPVPPPIPQIHARRQLRQRRRSALSHNQRHFFQTQPSSRSRIRSWMWMCDAPAVLIRRAPRGTDARLGFDRDGQRGACPDGGRIVHVLRPASVAKGPSMPASHEQAATAVAEFNTAPFNPHPQKEIVDDAKPAAAAPLEDVVEYVKHGIVKIETSDSFNNRRGLGSGFVIDPSGLVATNYHVVSDAAKADVVFNDGTRFGVEGYVAVDRSSDLAIIKLNGVPVDVKSLELNYADGPRCGPGVRHRPPAR